MCWLFILSCYDRNVEENPSISTVNGSRSRTSTHAFTTVVQTIHNNILWLHRSTNQLRLFNCTRPFRNYIQKQRFVQLFDRRFLIAIPKNFRYNLQLMITEFPMVFLFTSFALVPPKHYGSRGYCRSSDVRAWCAPVQPFTHLYTPKLSFQ